MPDEARYYVTCLGPGATDYAPVLEGTLRQRLADLGEGLDQTVAFLPAAEVPRRSPKAPIVGIYFGGSKHAHADIAAIRSLLDSAAVIIPVVESLQRYSSLVPPELTPINGASLSNDDK